jgi:hypothetical protein
MASSPDPASQGRLRRLLLTLAPMGVAAVTPWLLVTVYRDRLPDHAFVDGWSRVGAEFSHLAPTWSSWAAGYLLCLLWAGLLGLAFARFRRWPHLQRALAMTSWAVAASTIAEAVCAVAAVLDVQGYPTEPTAWWLGAVSTAAGLLGGAAGWAATGSMPLLPATAEAPPAGVRTRRLGPAERAMVSESVWSAKSRATGIALILCAPLVLLFNSFSSGAALGVLALGLAVVLQSKARILVDGTGVVLELPLLGGTRRRVPYQEIRHAEVIENGPSHGWWPVAENTRFWGYVTGRGPAMVLRLTEGPDFVASLRDPDSSVALVNGELTRTRTTGAAAEA